MPDPQELRHRPWLVVGVRDEGDRLVIDDCGSREKAEALADKFRAQLEGYREILVEKFSQEPLASQPVPAAYSGQVNVIWQECLHCHRKFARKRSHRRMRRLCKKCLELEKSLDEAVLLRLNGTK